MRTGTPRALVGAVISCAARSGYQLAAEERSLLAGGPATDSISQREAAGAAADKLGLTAEQRTKIREIRAEQAERAHRPAQRAAESAAGGNEVAGDDPDSRAARKSRSLPKTRWSRSQGPPTVAAQLRRCARHAGRAGPGAGEKLGLTSEQRGQIIADAREPCRAARRSEGQVP